MEIIKNNEEMERLKADIPRSGLEKILEILSVILIMAVSVYTVFTWRTLPSSIPTHYDFLGKPDIYGPKTTLLFIPGIVLLLCIFITVASYFPHVFNYAVRITEENYIRQYALAKKFLAVLRFEFCLVFSYLSLAGILTAKGIMKGLGWPFLIVTLIGLFGAMGLFVYKQIKAK